jgi:hypothetical protein
MNVKLIRMHSGEDVIADLIKEQSEELIINDPIVLVPGRDGTVGFAPWSPVISPSVKELRIRANYVVYVTEPNDDVVRNYNEIFSPIITPSNAGKIIS